MATASCGCRSVQSRSCGSCCRRSARLTLLKSVEQEPDDEPERPHALLALAETAEDDERERLLQELAEKYTLHAATEIARAKGMIR